MDQTKTSRQIGRISALALFFCAVAYAITLALGLISLKSPQDPIKDPYFTLMELLIFIMAPLMVVVMVAVHAYAAREDKVYSLIALAFMIMSAAITAGNHFVVMVASRQPELSSLPWLPLFLSFKWPSVIYILDILAWDVFYAFAMLFAAPVFKGGKLETAVRISMAVTGLLSIAGLIFLPFGNIQLRMIGIIGYAGLSPVVFLLLAFVFGRAKSRSEVAARSFDPELELNPSRENPQEGIKKGSFKEKHAV
jgi:hypothetical protein